MSELLVKVGRGWTDSPSLPPEIKDVMRARNYDGIVYVLSRSSFPIIESGSEGCFMPEYDPGNNHPASFLGNTMHFLASSLEAVHDKRLDVISLVFLNCQPKISMLPGKKPEAGARDCSSLVDGIEAFSRDILGSLGYFGSECAPFSSSEWVMLSVSRIG